MSLWDPTPPRSPSVAAARSSPPSPNMLFFSFFSNVYTHSYAPHPPCFNSGCVPLGSDATALAFGRGRALFAATANCELLTLRLATAKELSQDTGGGHPHSTGGGLLSTANNTTGGHPHSTGGGTTTPVANNTGGGLFHNTGGGTTGAVVTSVVSGAHRSLADAIAVSRDGRIVVSAGTDTTIKVWPAAFLCKVIVYIYIYIHEDSCTYTCMYVCM